MSNLITLTRTGFKGFEDVIINLDKVTIITPTATNVQGSTIWFGKTEICVVESMETIKRIIGENK